MMTVDGRLECTVTDVFARLEASGFRYALMRNHQAFPRFEHDIDLVLDSRQMPAWRALVASVAEQQGWDAVSQCRHWATSSYRHHNIESFLFYTDAGRACLQIDIFHGFLVLGLPLLDAHGLLQYAAHDARGFSRLQAPVENL
jgi:hypothetical protein